MFFDWDERKAAANWKKHRILFPEATEVFGDDLSSFVSDPDNSYGESRYLIFGKSLSGKALAYRSRRNQTLSVSSPPAA